MAFKIVRNDITKIKADAVVNTANPKVCVGNGVDSAIYEAAGREKLLDARRKLGDLKPGEVGITEAFDLDAKYIIHVSGPCWVDGTKGEEDVLGICYRKALELAEENGCTSIVFPLLSTGSYGFPKEIGIQLAIEVFTDFLQQYDMEITLAVLGSDAVNISGRLVGDVRSFIDDRKAGAILKKEYSRKRRSDGERNIPELAGGVDANEKILYEPLPLCEVSLDAKTSESLENVLKNIYKESFEKYLQRLIKEKGLKNSQVYAAANISKQYFSKLLKGQVKPSKEKVLSLAIGLQLNMEETVELLRVAGYALSPVSQTDAVVEYFIKKKYYNVLKIDIVLFDYGLEPLSNI